MTSKISFSKLLREELRHHGLVAGVYIGILTVHMFYTVMAIQNMVVLQLINSTEKSDIIAMLAEGCKTSVSFGLVIALLGAFSAVEGYAYLHSKRKMDFYGSLPVSRKRKFAVVMTVEWILFIAMILADILLHAAAITIFGYASSAAYVNLLCSGIIRLATYLISFATATLAMTLTGNVAVAVAGMNVLFWYGALIRFMLVEGYASTFFETYVESKKTFIDYCLSPATMLYKLYGLDGLFNDAWSFKKSGIWVLPIMVLTVLLLALSAYLYEKRISERAGNSLAFPKLGGLIEAIVIIPTALTAGLIFCLLSSAYQIIWMLAGMIAAVVGMYVIMECILNLDIRNLWKRKGYLICVGLICIAIAGVFVFDLTGYDDYLPNVKEVKAVLIEKPYEDAEYTNQELRSVSQVSQESTDKVLRMVALVMENQSKTSFRDIYTDDSYNINLDYVMKNGKIIKRTYRMETKEEINLLYEIYKDPEYVKNAMMVSGQRLQKMTDGEVYSVFGDDVILDRKQIQSLMKTYIKERADMPVPDGQDAVYQYNIIANWHNGSEEETDSYPIYPQYTQTLKQLENFGVSMVSLQDCEMTEIRISTYDKTKDTDLNYQVTDRDVILQYRDQLKIGWVSEQYQDDSEIMNVTVMLEGKDKEAIECNTQMSEEVFEKLKKYAKKWN